MELLKNGGYATGTCLPTVKGQLAIIGFANTSKKHQRGELEQRMHRSCHSCLLRCWFRNYQALRPSFMGLKRAPYSSDLSQGGAPRWLDSGHLHQQGSLLAPSRHWATCQPFYPGLFQQSRLFQVIYRTTLSYSILLLSTAFYCQLPRFTMTEA